MAKKNPIHASLLPNEGEAFEGFPRHGEEYPDEGYDPEAPEESYEDETGPEPQDDRWLEVERRFAELKAENDQLRRMIPPPQAIPPQPTASAQEEEPDWDKLLFENPKEALKLYGDRIEKRVKQDLTAAYQREQNTNRFWQTFYQDNQDLYEDHDLVSATLSKHMAELANLPTHVAQQKLADLTRQRILKYSNIRSQPRKGDSRARVEGAEAPAPKTTVEPPENVASLSSLLRARREARRNSGRKMKA